MKEYICDKCKFRGEKIKFAEPFEFSTFMFGNQKYDLCIKCNKELRKIVKEFLFKQDGERK